jgi:uncharacterized membrane protein YcjF (UPF0283 family)
MMDLLFMVISAAMIVYGTDLLISGWRLKQWLGMFLVASGMLGMAIILYVSLLNFVQ